MRPMQAYGWRDWVDSFYGGTGDPSFRKLDELVLYVDAVAEWHQVLHRRGHYMEEQLARLRQQISAASAALLTLALESES